MIRTTQWSPDTCGCTVDYTWDDTVAQDQRVHTFAAVQVKCAAHAAVADNNLYAVITDENPRKNRAEGRLLQAFPAKLGMTDPATGDLVLRPGAYSYQFLATTPRTLELSLPLLNSTERAAVQTWCDNNLGSGRVVVV